MMPSAELTLSVVIGALVLCVPAHAGESPPDPIIEITARSGDQPWIATYRFPRAIERFVFDRPASHFRESSWEVIQGDYRIRSDGEDEVLERSPEGEASAVITVRFPIDTGILEKDYEFFRRFTDGGLLMYTGHLYGKAYPVGGVPSDELSVQRLALEPRHGESLLIDGDSHRDRIIWLDERGEGTYAYFGNLQPLKSGVMTAVLDPGLPEWLRRRFKTLLPQLFAYYGTRTGTQLRIHPVVFFSFEEADISGTDWSGGVLPGMIQLDAKGRGWIRASPSALASVFQFLAHEAAHLWNGEMYAYSGDDDAWMHEGGGRRLQPARDAGVRRH